MTNRAFTVALLGLMIVAGSFAAIFYFVPTLEPGSIGMHTGVIVGLVVAAAGALLAVFSKKIGSRTYAPRLGAMFC